MKRKINAFLLTFLLLCGFAVAEESSISILPLDQIKPGMKGTGRTVFKGDKIEEFGVEILGILHNFQPRRNLILAKLESEVLDEAGVIEGMSGSPVYVGEKLIGAVAYSVGAFAKEAIAGITPIGEMLAISPEKGPASSFAPRMQVLSHLTLDELFELNKERFQLPLAEAEGRLVKPLSIPLVFSGFSPYVFEKAKANFSRMGFTPIQSGSQGQIQPEMSSSGLTLQPGSPIGVQLIKGDINVSYLGTVTHVDGNSVLAFGHPVFNLGPVDLAMTKARVITVLPSLMLSSWLAVSDVTIGRFVQDRTAGILGELGKMPKFIPINFKILDVESGEREFKIQVANDKILTPFLVNLAAASVISSEERGIGDLTLELNGVIYLDNGMNVRLEDLFSGNFDMASTNLSGLVTAVVYMLTTNEFIELGIHSIDLNITVAEEVRFAYLEKVWLEKYEAYPGERVRMKVYYRNFRGNTVEEEFPLPIPNLPSGSEFSLVVGDAVSLQSIEFRQYRTTSFVPRSLYQLVRMLNSLRRHNYIYFKIIATKPGLFLRGEEMPNLPPTMKSMFSSPRAASSPPIEITRSTLGEYRHVIPYVFNGLAVIPIKIK
ncbi:MAG: hypothetical protein AMJ73_02135 [candidate division Zixibacteria bacterium SM1_73]|nr:MAG: hypothetical protein AMJ73_02135 [candidate division Zixibacteria bacterium SM1_73]